MCPTKDMNKGKNAVCHYTVPADAMNSGVERNSGDPSLAPRSPVVCSSSHSRSSASDTSLNVSSSAGTRLPTSVEERKFSTARLQYRGENAELGRGEG